MTTSSGSGQPLTMASRGDPGLLRADPGDLRASCVRFGRLLRQGGVPVTTERVERWLRSLDLTGCQHPADLFWTGRICLAASPAHLPVYDELFRRFWLTLDHGALDPLDGTPARDPAGATPRSGAQPLPGRPDREGPEAEREGGGLPGAAASALASRWHIGKAYVPPGAQPGDSGNEENISPSVYSATELLRDKDFAAYSAVDEAALRRLLAGTPAWTLPQTLSRRTRPSGGGRLPDLRRTLAASVRWGGDPVRMLTRKRTLRRRRWVFLCDISASMSPYTRGLIAFLQAVAVKRRGTEVLVFGTRLTRITPQLLRRRAGDAEAVIAPVRDWHGGTRLGESLEQFLRAYGRRGMAHGAVLFVCSDGLDHGEPGRVGTAMAELRRKVRRLVWVNPLKASAGYQPLAQAMQEALPYVDELQSGHSLAALEALLRREASLE